MTGVKGAERKPSRRNSHTIGMGVDDANAMEAFPKKHNVMND